MEDLKKQQALKIQVELIWLLVTAVLIYIILYPMLNHFKEYRFLYGNIVFIAVFVTYTRYIFLLKHTFLAYLQPLKFILVFVSVPLVFHLIELLQGFQYFLETEGLMSIQPYFEEGTSTKTRESVYIYMSREMVFFGVASVIVAIMMPFRMLLSFWRVYNKTGRV
ncbi:MAG: hypothetical protein GY810_20805 [Aureispira sp.]|nr:hypothetical protein [Aureispira sp.]